MHRRLACLALAALFAAFPCSAADLAGRTPSKPRLYLWAWERPEDLRFLRSETEPVGVAYLAATVFVEPDLVFARPRLQPLRVDPATPLIAVVRIEARRRLQRISGNEREQILGTLLSFAAAPRVSGLQIDFDARHSELPAYRELISELRRRLEQTKPLSITALGSWCASTSALRDLKADDAVPMLFRMGTNAGAVRNQIARAGTLQSSKCSRTIGLSTDEPFLALPGERTVFLFAPIAWNADLLRRSRRSLP